MFEQYLIEILLTVILMFNVGAFGFLWSKTEDLEDEYEETEEELMDMKQSLGRLWNRIYGTDEDPTKQGHLQETQEDLDDICTQLSKISEKQDEQIEERKREHRLVRGQLEKLISQLSEEDSVEIDEEEFDLLSKDFY